MVHLCAVLGSFPKLFAPGGWGPRVKVGADGLGMPEERGFSSFLDPAVLSRFAGKDYPVCW